jgi:hypothetical protein
MREGMQKGARFIPCSLLGQHAHHEVVPKRRVSMRVCA